MRIFTFGCFSWKITFSLLIAFLVSKIAKRSEMSQIFLSCEANLHEKASSSFCLHRQSVKTWVGKSFSWQVGERKDRKTPLGRGYNLAITRVKSEKRDTWALTYPETNFLWWGFVIWLFLAKKKRKKEKKALFRFMHQTGFEPTTSKKWQNRMSKLPPLSFPRQGTCPSFSSLGGNRGKYIFKVQLIFIAKNFLIWEGP